MTAFDLDLLLSRSDLVQPVAPWCTVLSNLELALVMAAQPGIEGEGLRRSELERRVQTMVSDLGIGPTYFQRISRAVASLVERGILCAVGEGRSRRFRVAPEGFAALILNLRVMRSDPTVDGSEFELKRSVVALWNAVYQEFLDWDVDVAEVAAFDGFFDDVEKVTVWDQQVISDELVAEAFDVFALIELQRKRVQELKEHAQAQLARSRKAERLFGSATPEVIRKLAPSLNGQDLAKPPEMLQVVAAAATAPRLEAQVVVVRYDAYLSYLDRLRELYEINVQVIDFQRLRARRQQTDVMD